MAPATTKTPLLKQPSSAGAVGAHVRMLQEDARTRRRIRAAVLRHGLDRRKIYTAVDGVLATAEKFTMECSGCRCDCGDGHPCSHGCGGCRECGYTGKRVVLFSCPVTGDIPIRDSKRAEGGR